MKETGYGGEYSSIYNFPNSSLTKYYFNYSAKKEPTTSINVQINQDIPSIVSDLKKWCVDDKIPHSSVSKLLKILKKHDCFSTLPLDAQSLVKTPRIIPLYEVTPGRYCHIGLLNQIKNVLPLNVDVDELNLQFSIDGVPISKSSGKQFWPILCYILEFDKIIEIGIYEGNEKPKLSSDFLQRFVTELKTLCDNGVNINNKKFKINIDSFICDAPARAIKGHSGYFGCGKCTQEGEYIKNRVTFPQVNCSLRTDQSFRDKLDEDHHHAPSELEKLNFDLVKQTPFEYMHLVCIGVVKKLILLWMSGNINKFRLSCREKLQITRNLIILKPFIPCEFARKPRPIEEIRRWKATELRQFLLYSGPIALKLVLPQKYYDHFICLHLAIRILCCKINYKNLNSYASSLLVAFVSNFGKLYGEENLSYNVHGLVHLAEDSLRLGPLDKFSAFKFEDHLGYVTSLLKGKNRTLEQAYNRITERNNIIRPTVSFNHREEILNNSKTELYSDKFTLKLTIGNNVCELKSGEIIQILSFTLNNNGEVYCKGKVLRGTEPFYNNPEDSNIVGTRTVTLSSATRDFPTHSILRKCVLLPYTGNFVLFPLLH